MLPMFSSGRAAGDRLGPVLFKPAVLSAEDDRLAVSWVRSRERAMRARVPQRVLYVDEVYELLGTCVALVHAEGEKPRRGRTLGTTSSFAYARLRKREGYTDADVDAWSERLRPMLEAGKDVYAYFRHDDTGANALSAERLRDRLAA